MATMFLHFAAMQNIVYAVFLELFSELNFMKNRTVVFALLLCASLAFLTSCSEVAITGRQQLNLVSDSSMNSMSEQSYRDFISKAKISTDSEQTQVVRTVGSNIAAAVEKYCNQNNMADRVSGYSWEFNLIDDPAENAWAMPGGKVVVYSGILKVTQNDTGLAVVMSHEIAHIVARHGNERMSQALMVDMGGMALSQALANSPGKTQNLFLRSYSIGSEYGFMLPYSRVQETEADRLGLIFMAMASYNPSEALAFWQRMSAGKQGSQVPELLSTHPTDQRRIENIQSFLPEAMGYYNQGQ